MFDSKVILFFTVVFPPSVVSLPAKLSEQHLLAEFRKESGIDLSGDTLAMQRLREAAEKVRKLTVTLVTDHHWAPMLVTTIMVF